MYCNTQVFSNSSTHHWDSPCHNEQKSCTKIYQSHIDWKTRSMDNGLGADSLFSFLVEFISIRKSYSWYITTYTDVIMCVCQMATTSHIQSYFTSPTYRGAEIIYSLAVAHAHHHANKDFPEARLMRMLVTARRNLGLFQHHDGITGTAKDFVVVDYGNKWVVLCMSSISGCVSSMLARYSSNMSH